MARLGNEAVGDAKKTYPDRFGGFATLPMLNAKSAMDELAFALDELELDGVTLMTNYKAEKVHAMASRNHRTLHEYIPGSIWLKEYPIRYAGCRFNARMVVVRLGDGRLMIHSPCPIDDHTKLQIDALGPVAIIVAPGNYHYLNIRSAQKAFPDAETHICPGVEKKDSSLSYTKLLSDEPDAILAGDFDQVLVRGTRFITEIAFFHRATKTLILADLIENYGDETTQPKGWLVFWWKFVFHMWNRPKPAPEYQMGWKDKASAKTCLEQILRWDFDKIIISHGDLIENDAQRIARSAWQEVLQTTSKQKLGHYIARKSKLLADLEHTFVLMSDRLSDRYGKETSQRMQESVRTEYEALIPDIPYIEGARARMLNTFLRITAQELAAYKGLSKFGKPPQEVWEICHQALRLRVEEVPRWKRWLLRKLMFSKLVKAVMARRARQHQVGHFGEFEIEYLNSVDKNFDVGINYRRCGNYQFVMEHGGEEFAPYICMSDIALSEAMGWGLTRTQTLADGCDYCDFRMKRGASTQITSRTPEVQKTIESIHRRERNDQIIANSR